MSKQRKTNPSRASKWLSDNFDKVAAKYPDEWVIASPKGVIAHSKYLTEIESQMNGKDRAVMFVPAPGKIIQ